MTERKQNEQDRPGNDAPLEEVGPGECELKAESCEIKPGDIEEQPEGSHPKFSEELLESYEAEPDFMVPSPVDGLPTPADDRPLDDSAFAPPFTYEHVVCIEDDRRYVSLFTDEVEERGYPLQAEDGSRLLIPFRYVKGVEQDRAVFEPSTVLPIQGRLYARRKDGTVIPVRPIRERCKYYQRQVFSNDAVPDPKAPGHKIVFRNCTIRRSVGGAYMSLRDEAVYACDYRSPPDPKSVERHIDGPDRHRLTNPDHHRRLPFFKG